MLGATVDILVWIHEEVYGHFRASDCAAAAENNNLPALMYLHEEGCPWDEQTIFAAVEHGHLDCLKYAWESDCPMPSNEQCLYGAARFGRIEVLKYFQSLGFEFDEWTLQRAICADGTLECVKYLVEAGWVPEES